MTFGERNDFIDEMLCKYKVEHDKYTTGMVLLEDPDWEDYIHSMDAICAEHKGTNLELLAGKLCMAFLDDTELIQKKLKELTNDT
jgi:hypothetical protein